MFLFACVANFEYGEYMTMQPNKFSVFMLGLLAGLVFIVFEFEIASPVVFIVLGTAVALWVIYRWRPGLWIVALVVGVSIGLYRGQLASTLQYETLDSNIVEGVVLSTEEREKNIKLEVRDSRSGQRLLVYGDVLTRVSSGNKVRIEGEIQRPEEFEGFNWPMYLAAKDIYYVSYYPDISVVVRSESSVLSHIQNIRTDISDRIKQLLPRDVGGIVQAMVVGLRGDIPESVVESFRRSGLSHMLAVSGLHMGLVGFLVYRGLIRFIPIGRRVSAIIAATMMAGYVILSGVSPSALRSALMAGVILTAVMISEKTQYSRLLLLVAAALAFIQPLQLRWDASFMLSFSAVAGIIATKSLFDHIFKWIPNILKIRDVLSISLAVQTTTWPIVLGMFGMVSVISPIVNVLVALLIAPFLASSIVLVVSAVATPILSFPLAVIVWGFGSIIVAIARFASSVPIAAVHQEGLNAVVVAIYYSLLALGVVYWRNYYKRNLTPQAVRKREGL